MTPRDLRRAAARKAAEKRSRVGSSEDRRQVNRLRRECKARRAKGENVRVGHIIPLRHPLVSGLTCIANLMIISAEADDRMGNKFTPGRQSNAKSMF